MSSAIWDWVAICEGLRSADGTFVPLYWMGPARLFRWLGWTPVTPETCFAVLTALSLVAVGLSVGTRRRVWLCVASLMWGALLADTPYVLVLPFAVWFVCFLGVHVRHTVWNRLVRFSSRRLDWKEPAAVLRTPWGPCLFSATVGCALALAVNLVRFESAYPRGYVRRAIAAVRWDGFSWSPNALRMDALLDEYVTELAREGAGRKWIFTDGLCDSGIELAAAATPDRDGNGPLRAVSLVGGVIDKAAAHEKGFTRNEDLFALSCGAAQLLRTWAVDRPAELTNAVYQCGFEFLDQVAGDRVESCGLVMTASTVRGEGPASAVRSLGERIVAFRTGGGAEIGAGRLRAVRFGAMQWRVARAIRRQAQILDRAGRVDEAKAAVALSERLDELNPFAHAASAGIDPADSRAFGSLSPREGLTFALKRADFPLACRYAKPILEDDPNDAAANFAMAMGHFKMKEFTLARVHFEKALAVRPDDPALLNNLAMALLELGELDAARTKAAAAQKLKPDSLAIRETLHQIDKRRKAAREVKE